MEEEVENDIEFSQDIFQKSIDMLKKKTGHKYDFILKSGESYRHALFTLFTVIWDKERKPDIWGNTVLLQLFKGRGSLQDVQNYRNIHTKEEVPQGPGALVRHQECHWHVRAHGQGHHPSALGHF